MTALLSYDVAAMPTASTDLWPCRGRRCRLLSANMAVLKNCIPKEALGSKLASMAKMPPARFAKFGGQRVDVPRRTPWRLKTQILALKDQYYPSMIARKVGTTQSYVRRLRDCDDKPKPKKQNNQPSLF